MNNLIVGFEKLNTEFYRMLESEQKILRVKIKKSRIRREASANPDNVYEHGYFVGKLDQLELIMVLFGSLNLKAAQEEQKKKEMI